MEFYWQDGHRIQSMHLWEHCDQQHRWYRMKQQEDGQEGQEEEEEEETGWCKREKKMREKERYGLGRRKEERRRDSKSRIWKKRTKRWQEFNDDKDQMQWEYMEEEHQWQMEGNCC